MLTDVSMCLSFLSLFLLHVLLFPNFRDSQEADFRYIQQNKIKDIDKDLCTQVIRPRPYHDPWNRFYNYIIIYTSFKDIIQLYLDWTILLGW